MIVEKQKARATLLGRRKRAIIIFSLTFIVLLATAITVNHFVRFVPFEDVDGTEYRVVLKAGKYGLSGYARLNSSYKPMKASVCPSFKMSS